MTQHRRVLSIDGGGIKGIFAAAFLSDIEETLPNPIYSYFDLIVGTSTGGIIAIGLSLGFTASELVTFYRTYGPTVFGGSRLVNSVKQLVWRKYSNKPLRDALKKTFEDRLLGHAKTRLVVPSMNIDTGEVHLFKTAHHQKFERDYKVLAMEAALATASAPTYFPTLRTRLNFPLVDGGLWANNPCGVAAVEAVGVLGWPRASTKILSLGCTDEPFDLGWLRTRNLGGLWATKMVDTFMRGQSSGSMGTAYSLVGHENVVRINQTVTKGRFALDSPKGIEDLCALGKNRARNESARIKSSFFSDIAEPFVPTKKV